MPAKRSPLRFLIVVMSIVLVGGYVVLQAGGRLMGGSKSARVFPADQQSTTQPTNVADEPASKPTHVFLPGSKSMSHVIEAPQQPEPRTPQQRLMSGSKSGAVFKEEDVRFENPGSILLIPSAADNATTTQPATLPAQSSSK